jgi:phenylalanyl-tRNA synthetase beta subunit
MKTKTTIFLTPKSIKSAQTIEEVEKKESGEKLIPFREAIRGFWEKFDTIYGTNLTHEKIQDYDYRNRIQ